MKIESKRRVGPFLMGLACVAVAAGGAAACADGPERRAYIESDSAGVRIVENPALDRAADLVPAAVAELTTPDGALTAVPWGIAANPMTGRIYIADMTDWRVAVFDRDGAHVGTFGRRGEGPGEFLRPSAVSIGPHGALSVWDAGRGVVSRWSGEGDLLNEERPPVTYWGPAFHEGPDRLVTVTASSSAEELRQDLIEVSGGEQRVLHSVARDYVMMEIPCARMPAFRVFAPSVVWGARERVVYVLNGPGYRIDVIEDGGLAASYRRRVDPVPVTEAMAAERARAGEYQALMRMCDLSAEQVVRAVGHEERVSPVQHIAVDPGGRLWITRSLTGVAPIEVDVLDAAGRYEGTMQAPAMPVAFVSPSRFVGFGVREGTGEAIVALYELRELDDAHAPSRDGSAAAAPARHPDVRELRDCAACPVVVELPPGRFLMGAADGEEPAARNRDRPAWTEAAEKPQVEVEIGYRFAIGKYPVTFEEWDRCVDAGACTYRPDDAGWGRGDRPVIHVARSDAERYVDWLRAVTGQPYRLPSEAEWEYAARAATATARWWGDALGSGHTACDGCGSRWDDRSTAPVGSFPPNAFGLHDMLGNVSEWVADCWHDSHEGAPADGSARIETSPWWRNGECARPMYKGGSWGSFPWAVRAATRLYYWEGPSTRWTERDSRSRGFRVARDVRH